MYEMRASVLAPTRGGDMQFKVPSRPAVRQGVQLRQLDDGVIVDGAIQGRRFQGEFARQSLPALVALLDGQHTHTQIAAELDLSEDAVYCALALLWTSGVIEDAAADNGAQAPSAQRCYLSRIGDVTANDAHWSQTLERVRATRVAVIGQGAGAELSSLLAEEGLQVCDVAQIRPKSRDLVICLTADDEMEDVHVWADHAWDSGQRLLPVLVRDDGLVIGPMIDATFSPCLRCAVSDRPARAMNGSTRSNDALVAGIVAREVLALVGGIGSSGLPLDRVWIERSSGWVRFLPVSTRSGCPWCSTGIGELDERTIPAARYEAAVAAPPREFVAVKGHQAHYQEANIQLQTEFRAWPGLPRVALPRLSPGDIDAPVRRDLFSGTRSMDLPALSCMLEGAVGLRERMAEQGKTRRWTAMGGNIGAITAYAAVLTVAGLEDGCYAYDDHRHELVRIGQVPTFGGSAHPALRLYMVGDVDKVARKYGAFALRVVLQDAACALVTAGHVLSSLDIAWQPILSWSEAEVRGSLRLQGRREIVCTALSAGGHAR